MTKNQLKSKLTDLISKNAVCGESKEIVHSLNSFIQSANVQNENITRLQSLKALDIYKKRRTVFELRKKECLGLKELLSILENRDGDVLLIQLKSDAKSMTFFLNEELELIIGVIVIDV